MEKDIQVGQVGEVALKQEGAVASVVGSLSKKMGPLTVKVSVDAELDELALLKSLAEKYGHGSILGDLIGALEGAIAPAAPAVTQ